MPRVNQIQLRRDTAANWTSVNPTLAAGEVGVETNTGKFKIGNGTSAWASLAYTSDVSIKANLAGGNTFTGTQTFGTPLAVGSGGTGASTLASGGYLKGTGTSAITSQSGIPASDITSGTLSIARGGTGNALGAGSTLLANSTFGGQTSVALDNIFTADFVYYDIYITAVGSAASGFGMRLRSGSTDLAGNGYLSQRAVVQNTSFVGESYPGAAQFEIGTLRTAGYGFWAGSIALPFLAEETQFIFNGFDRTQRQENTSGYNNSAASYNGIRIFNTVGVMTGNIRVYGRRA